MPLKRLVFPILVAVSLVLSAFMPVVQAATPLSAEDLDGFLSPMLVKEMKELHIPGAVVTVVKEGQVLFAKGYGYADPLQKTPVAYDKTLFRIGSVSKLFTATAVMQQYERGRIKLDEDVNRYLTLFKLPAKYPRPMTCADLLTHSGGLSGVPANPVEALQVMSLGQFLAEKTPVQLYPPGERFCYSNHNFVLLGYLVEVVSETPFADYMEANIFKPLGMTRSTFRMPPPQDISTVPPQGYFIEGGVYKAWPYFYFNEVPAGTLATTAADMARFMIAHLQGGSCGEARILKEETVAEMHRHHFTISGNSGMAYGFLDRVEDGDKILWHDGDLAGFCTKIILYPERKIGFFISYNAYEPMLREIAELAFTNRYIK